MRAGQAATRLHPAMSIHWELAMTEEVAKSENDQRQWAMFCHLSGLLGFIGPLVLWLLKKDEMPVVDSNGKEALNFQLTIFIAYVIAGALTFVLIGFFLYPVILLVWLILTIMASVKANSGELNYKYPFAIRLIK
jgi:uncharacterized Tic20 family protein